MPKTQETIDALYSIYSSTHAEVHFTVDQMDALSEAMRAVENDAKTPEPLTKLEQFTMAAMQGLLASGEDPMDKLVYGWSVKCAQATLAQLSETDT